MAEVSSNASLGIAYFIFLGLNSTISFVLPLLVKSLGPVKLYYIFGGMSLVVTIIHLIVVKDTSHLTDRDKKQLYVPDHLKIKETVIDSQ